MKRELLSDAVGMLDADIVDGHFKMKERIKRRKRLRGVILKSCAAAAVFCLLFAGAFSPEIKERITSSTLYQRVFGPGGDITSEELTIPEDLPEPWERFNMSRGVYGGLLRAQSNDTKLVVRVQIQDDAAHDAFIYEGKSYAEYAAERDALKIKLEALKELDNAENSDEMRAVKKELVTLADLAQEASSAYWSYAKSSVCEIFAEQEIESIIKNGAVFIKISYNDFMRLDIENSDKLFFDAAQQNAFESPENEIDELAYLSKLKFFWITLKYTLTEEGDVERVIKDICSQYRKEDEDYLEFDIKCSASFDDSYIELLDYYEFTRKDEKNISIKIKIDKLDISELEKLMKRDKVYEIQVKHPRYLYSFVDYDIPIDLCGLPYTDDQIHWMPLPDGEYFAMTDGYTTLYGFYIICDYSAEIMRAENGKILPISFFYYGNCPDDFVYDGKTYAEYVATNDPKKNEAKLAYGEMVSEKMYNELKAKGYPVIWKNDRMYIFTTLEELDKIEIENRGDYMINLAHRMVFEVK